MSKERKVQISVDLWNKIIYFFAADRRDDTDLYNAILGGINDKIQSQIRHDLYTQYKTASTEEQREQARQEYLDQIGVPNSFRRDNDKQDLIT